MPITLTHSGENVSGQALLALLKQAGLGIHTPQRHKQAFENSQRTVYLWDGDCLIGCGRMLSDGAYQAAIYDVAVNENYQGRGLGRKMMDALLQDTAHMNVLLYAAPGKQPFYERFGFGKAKTGMARFVTPDKMAEKGFLE